MKVTVEDIMKIKKGKAKTFILDTPNECHSLVSLVGYVKRVRKPVDIQNYTTTTEWDVNAVTIRAL